MEADRALRGHPLKAFMRYVGFEGNLQRMLKASPQERLAVELAVYRKTLTRAVDIRENLTSLSLVGATRLQLLYKVKEPHAAPEYLYWERGSSWSFIAQEAQREIEVFWHREGDPQHPWQLIYSSLVGNVMRHFFSCHRIWLVTISREEEEKSSFAAEEAGIEDGAATWQLRFVTRPPESLSHPFFQVPTTRREPQRCAYQQWMQAAGYENAPTLKQTLTLPELLLGKGGPLPSACPAALVVYRGCPSLKQRGYATPQRHQFLELRTCGPVHVTSPVVCVSPWDRSMYRLMPKFALAWYGRGVRGKRTCGSRPAPRQQEEEAAAAAAEEEEEEIATTATTCQCEACRQSAQWASNMNVDGPQTQFKTPLDLSSLLHLAGLDSADMKTLVERCLDHSVASFDIESCSTLLQEGRPAFGIASSARPPDRTRMKALAVQDPYMIGLCLGDRTDQTAVFEVGPGEVEDDAFIARVQAMVDSFQTFLIQQYDTVVRQKRGWMKPLFDLLDTYRHRHCEAFLEKGRAREAERKAWRHMLLGQLEYEADLLCQTWTVYAFNGSGYDLPMLAPYLLRSRTLPGMWHMQRQGTSVNWMKLRHTQLTLRDIKKMLVPGASLESFAKSTGLPQAQKPLFPYERLDRSGRFLDAAELPLERQAYASSLTDQLPTAAEIAKARQDFRQRGFRTVRQYLHYYLINDCVMLQGAILRFHRKLKDLIQLHPVECRRYTLSSFSALASQHHLRRGKRLACWAPTQGLLYELLSRSMLGGLTAVTRTAVNAGGEPGVSPCNAHVLAQLLDQLAPEEREEAQRILAQERAYQPPFSSSSSCPSSAATAKDDDDDKEVYATPRLGSPTTVHYLDCVSLYPSSGRCTRLPSLRSAI